MTKKARLRRPLPPITKTPRVPASAGDTSRLKPRWSLVDMDLEGPLGWERATAEDLKKILERLRRLETMSWAEIERQKSSHLWDSCDDLCRDATRRLVDLGLDDQDPYQLQVEGKARVWGFRDGQVFRVLWWDPDHTVFPVPKRNT